jgi:hypothetical protein
MADPDVGVTLDQLRGKEGAMVLEQVLLVYIYTHYIYTIYIEGGPMPHQRPLHTHIHLYI